VKELKKEAEKCFGMHGKMMAEELVIFMKDEGIIGDFVVNHQ
jgi:hypothetical protein